MTLTDPALHAPSGGGAPADGASLAPLLGAAVAPPELTADELAVLVRVERAVDEVIAPLAADHDAAGRYPTRALDALRATGLLSLAVPAELGGVGAGHAASLEAQVRLAAADSSVAQVAKVHDELVREIFRYCPDALREPLAERVVRHRHVIGLAVAEAGARVDAPWTTTTVPHPTADGPGWRIDGTKIYTTGAAEADEIAVWGFDPTADGAGDDPLLGVRLSLVPRGTPGVVVHRDWDALGQRATDSGTVTFDGVVVAAEAQASVPGRAPLPQSSLRYQAGFAAVLVGIGFGALRSALPFVAERSRPWPSADVATAADDPMVRRLCGELAAELAAAYHATMPPAALLDPFERGELRRTELAVPIYAAKAAASRAAMSTTSQLHALMGTRSVGADAGFDRWWRNARTVSLHDPLDWKHEEIGRHLLTGWQPEPGIYT